MRVLSKGSRVPFADDSVGWGEATNFKDYDVVFVDLNRLAETAEEYDHPYNGSANSPQTFDPLDVSAFVRANGCVIAYLPSSPVVEMGGSTTSAPERRGPTERPAFEEGSRNGGPYAEYDLLDWLPFHVTVSDDEAGSSVAVRDERWAWYFGDEFAWNATIEPLAPGSSYRASPIATNSYGGAIATAVSFRYDDSTGYVALVPTDGTTTYAEFVESTLRHVFDVEGAGGVGSGPSWLADYTLPNETELAGALEAKREEVETLETELESLTRFKRLLYGSRADLDGLTGEAFRELGFTVRDGEPEGHDGVVEVGDATVVLAIDGASDGVDLAACRRLDGLVEATLAAAPDADVSGLLVANPGRDDPPDERTVELDPDVEQYMRKRGDYKLLTSADLYRLVEARLRDELEPADVEALFAGEETLLSLSEQFTEPVEAT